MAPLAENVACRLLAHAFQKINKLDHLVTYSSIPLNLYKESVEAPVSFANYVMYKELMNGKDTFGADSTVLVLSNEEGKNIAYRIQVMLGSSNIMTEAEKKKATGKKVMTLQRALQINSSIDWTQQWMLMNIVRFPYQVATIFLPPQGTLHLMH